jgi:predicted nucleic acid-binding protein
MTSDGPRLLVVDPSVAIAIALQEPGYDLAVSVLRERGKAGRRLIVPAFFWLEVVNVLIKRHRLPPAVVLEALVDLETLELESIELERPQLVLTIDAMGRGALSAYDAAYLALAESADAELLTFDRRLAAAAGSRALPIEGGPAIQESPEPYTESWAEWPGAAAYLKQLRAQVVRQANG